MRKRILPFVTLFTILFFVSCSNSGDEQLSLTGVWEVVEISYEKQYDLNYDGIFNTDFRAEYPGPYERRITLLPDGTGSHYILSPIVWNLAPEVGYTYVPDWELIRDMTWSVDQNTQELVYTLPQQNPTRYQISGNQLIYTLPMDSFRQAYTGDDSETDTITFIYEKVAEQ